MSETLKPYGSASGIDEWLDESGRILDSAPQLDLVNTLFPQPEPGDNRQLFGSGNIFVEPPINGTPSYLPQNILKRVLNGIQYEEGANFMKRALFTGAILISDLLDR